MILHPKILGKFYYLVKADFNLTMPFPWVKWLRQLPGLLVPWANAKTISLTRLLI
jgi:hypothetical protein